MERSGGDSGRSETGEEECGEHVEVGTVMNQTRE